MSLMNALIGGRKVPNRYQFQTLKQAHQVQILAAKLTTAPELQPEKMVIFASTDQTGVQSNLAASTASAIAQRGQHVLLIALNENAPANFANIASVGMTDVLSEKSSIDQAISSSGELNLDVITLGKAGLQWEADRSLQALAGVVAQLKQQHDWLIFDAPSMANSTLAMTLAANTDAQIIFSLWRDHASLADTDEAINMLKTTGATIFGSVLLTK